MECQQAAVLAVGSSDPTTAAAVVELQHQAGLGQPSAYNAVMTARPKVHRMHNSVRKSKNGTYISSNTRSKGKIRALEKELARKLEQAKALEIEHARLETEHNLLCGCCDGLQLLRLQQGEDKDIDKTELALLQQLQDITYSAPANGSSRTSSSPSIRASAECKEAARDRACRMENPKVSAEAASLEDPLQMRLSPANDKMYFFRYMLSQAAFPGAKSLTLEGLAADYACTVHRLSLQLHLASSSYVGKGPPDLLPARKVKDIIDRHCRLMTTLTLQQREDLVQSFTLSNFETLEQLDELSLSRHEWLIEAAGITETQQADVAAGMDVFNRLLLQTLQERVLLQQQTAAAEQETLGGKKYKIQLDLHEQRLKRLSLLFRKELLTRIAASAWVLGNLTYQQVCMLLVKSTPYPAAVILVGKVCHERQQQLQRQAMLSGQKRQ